MSGACYRDGIGNPQARSGTTHGIFVALAADNRYGAPRTREVNGIDNAAGRIR